MSDSKQLAISATINFLNSHNIHVDTLNNDPSSGIHFKLPLNTSTKISADFYIVCDDTAILSMGHVPISFQRTDLSILAEFAHRVNKELIHGTLLFDYDKCTLDFRVTIPNIAFTDDADNLKFFLLKLPHNHISKVVQAISQLAVNKISLIQAAKFAADE